MPIGDESSGPGPDDLRSDRGAPTRFDTRRGFRDALCRSLDDAIAHEAGELRWVDADFEAWPLDDADLRDRLARWAVPGRRLTLFAQTFDGIVRRHPRFVAWRRLHTDVVHGRAVHVEASDMPTLALGGPGDGLVVFNRDRWTGRAVLDLADWRTWSEVVDALMQQSSESFAATTLGI